MLLFAKVRFVKTGNYTTAIVEIACISPELTGYQLELLGMGGEIVGINIQYISNPQVFY